MTLRDAIASFPKSLFSFFKNSTAKVQSQSEGFWALKDIPFEIKQGDRRASLSKLDSGEAAKCDRASNALNFS